MTKTMSKRPLSASIAKEIVSLRVCLFRLQKKIEVGQEIQKVRAELETLVQAYPEEAACVERVRAGEGSEQDEELLRVDYHFGLRPEWVRRARTGIQRYAFWRRGDLDPERQTPGMLGRYGVDARRAARARLEMSVGAPGSPHDLQCLVRASL